MLSAPSMAMPSRPFSLALSTVSMAAGRFSTVPSGLATMISPCLRSTTARPSFRNSMSVTLFTPDSQSAMSKLVAGSPASSCAQPVRGTATATSAASVASGTSRTMRARMRLFSVMSVRLLRGGPLVGACGEAVDPVVDQRDPRLVDDAGADLGHAAVGQHVHADRHQGAGGAAGHQQQRARHADLALLGRGVAQTGPGEGDV